MSHRHYALCYQHGAPGHRPAWAVETEAAARKLARSLQRRQGVVEVVYSPPCDCATPDVAPADPLAACDPAEVEALAATWAALVRQQWDAAHPSTQPQVA